MVASWRCSAWCMSTGCCSHRRVDPSTSVNRNVMVPDGGPTAGRSLADVAGLDSSTSTSSVRVESSTTDGMKRYPRPRVVSIIRCALPSSPRAWRTALIREVSADSLTNRSPQILSSSSSFGTTRSRCSIRYERTSKTWRSSATRSPPRRSSNRSRSNSNSSKRTPTSRAYSSAVLQACGQPA